MTITIYVTFPNSAEAKKIINSLLKKRLVACANFWPIKSAYWWQAKIQNDDEIAAFLKTKKENWEKVKAEIKKMHSDQVPCIEKITTEANKEYETWIKDITK